MLFFLGWPAVFKYRNHILLIIPGAFTVVPRNGRACVMKKLIHRIWKTLRASYQDWASGLPVPSLVLCFPMKQQCSTDSVFIKHPWKLAQALSLKISLGGQSSSNDWDFTPWYTCHAMYLVQPCPVSLAALPLPHLCPGAALAFVAWE